MSLLNLVLYPDAPLLEKAEPFDTMDSSVMDLANDMLDTMIAYDGVGLAGPQVGVSKRIVVMQEPEGPPMCLINPEFTIIGSDQLTHEEGCLSLPELYAPVSRAARVKVKALDAKGKHIEFEAEDLLARIVQHETDHLEGVCFVDRLNILLRQDKLEEWAELRRHLLHSVEGS